MDTSSINAVFFVTIGGIICGGVGLAIKACYKVKCARVECCGCVVERDIETEAEIDQTRAVNRRGSGGTI